MYPSRIPWRSCLTVGKPCRARCSYIGKALPALYHAGSPLFGFQVESSLFAVMALAHRLGDVVLRRTIASAPPNGRAASTPQVGAASPLLTLADIVRYAILPPSQAGRAADSF